MLKIVEFYGNTLICIKTNEKIKITKEKEYKIINDFVTGFSIINDDNEEIFISTKYIRDYFYYD